VNNDEVEMVRRIDAVTEERLSSVVAYGPALDHSNPRAAEYLLIVLTDLEPDTLRRLAQPVRWWLTRDRPWPRLFTRELLHVSADVFPIELLDISTRHRVLYGDDPTTDVVIERGHLRLQVEREMREKLMRLREGYVECHASRSSRCTKELLAASYTSFVRIFRACLHLVGAQHENSDDAVITMLGSWLDLAPDSFDGVARIARGERVRDVEAAFGSYYRALSAVESRVDRMLDATNRRTP
jgi:hypothetical protein